MLKKLRKCGKLTTVPIEINIISKEGIWILVNGQEFFLSFTEHPWFTKATIEQIYDVKQLSENHLHWPLLDVDLEVESLKNPAAYPLKFQK